MSAQQRSVAFPLDILGHFRLSVRWLTASAVLVVATWWLDGRTSRQPFDGGALLAAVLAGICCGIAMALAVILSLRACWCYRAARVGGGRRSAFSIDHDGISLHLQGCELSWTEIGSVGISGRPMSRRGYLLLGAADTGPLSTTLSLSIELSDRLAFGTRGAALKAWSAYGTPFAVDLRAIAAERREVEDAVCQFASGHCRIGRPDPERQPLRRARIRPAALWHNALARPEPAGGSLLARHSIPMWLLLLVTGAVVMGIGGWAQTTPFRDAWLLQHGLPATATVVTVITPCSDRQTGEWEVSYPGQFGETEFANTSDLWACPPAGATVPIMFDRANPGHVGDVRVLRNRPFTLFLNVLLVTVLLLVLNMVVLFWREPPARE